MIDKLLVSGSLGQFLVLYNHWHVLRVHEIILGCMNVLVHEIILGCMNVLVYARACDSVCTRYL